MKLIVCNDDFGVSWGLSEAVRDSYLSSITTATSVRVDSEIFEATVKEVLPTVPGLELGLHLNLTEGRPVADPSTVPDLVDRAGRFRRSFVGYLRAAVGRRRAVMAQVDRELAAQFAKAADSGLAGKFVNGNQHVHMIPGIFESVCRLARHHGISYVRVPLEPFHLSRRSRDNLTLVTTPNLAKHALLNRLSRRALPVLRRYRRRCVGSFIGVLFTGHMTPAALDAALASVRPSGEAAAEVLFHPANIDDRRDREVSEPPPRYYFSRDRRVEKEQLLGAEMQRLLERRRVELVNHSRLARSA